MGLPVVLNRTGTGLNERHESVIEQVFMPSLSWYFWCSADDRYKRHVKL
jgi:hypothetical protein